MTTPLGAGMGAGETVSVINTGSTAIPRGAIVSLKASTLGVIGADVVQIEVELAGTPTKYYGIATSAIPVNGQGTVTVQGPVLCLVQSSVTAGKALKVNASDYTMVNQGGSGTIVAVSHEAARQISTAPDFTTASMPYYAVCTVNFAVASASYGYTG